jgi:hypothetical protein
VSYEQERADLTAFLNTNWVATPIDWENSPSGDPALPFIQPTILGGASNGISLGYATTRFPSVLSINLWFAQGSGTITPNQYADDLIDLFKGADIGTNVQCMAPYKTVLGEADGRYQINVTIPFERRE